MYLSHNDAFTFYKYLSYVHMYTHRHAGTHIITYTHARARTRARAHTQCTRARTHTAYHLLVVAELGDERRHVALLLPHLHRCLAFSVKDLGLRV